MLTLLFLVYLVVDSLSAQVVDFEKGKIKRKRNDASFRFVSSQTKGGLEEIIHELVNKLLAENVNDEERQIEDIDVNERKVSPLTEADVPSLPQDC
jgi:hypothetical protein